MSCRPKRWMLRDEVDGKEKANGRLPDEILLRIFCHLPKHDLLKRAALVCRDWARVAVDPTLWKEVELRGWKLTAEDAKELIRHMTMLRKVRLVGWRGPRVYRAKWKSPADELLLLIALSHPKLEVLELEWCEVASMDCLEQVASRCADIKELAVKKGRVCHGNYRHIFDVFGRSSKLEKITLEDNTFLCCRLDRSMERDWPQLREVHLFQDVDEEVEVVCRSASGSLLKLGIHSKVGSEALLHLNQCTLLEDLSLNVEKISDLNEAIGNLRNLRRLACTGWHAWPYYGVMDWNSFFSMQEVVLKLERVDLGRTKGVDDQCLSLIATNCPELISLCLLSDQITKNGLEHLLTLANKLKSLEILFEYRRGIDPRDLKELCTRFPEVDVVELQ